MNPNVANVLAAAELLSVEERRQLVDLLLGGLDDPTAEDNGETPTLSEAWRQEIARRSAEYDAGQAESVSWPEMQARWQSRMSSDG